MLFWSLIFSKRALGRSPPHNAPLCDAPAGAFCGSLVYSVRRTRLLCDTACSFRQTFGKFRSAPGGLGAEFALDVSCPRQKSALPCVPFGPQGRRFCLREEGGGSASVICFGLASPPPLPPAPCTWRPLGAGLPPARRSVPLPPLKVLASLVVAGLRGVRFSLPCWGVYLAVAVPFEGGGRGLAGIAVPPLPPPVLVLLCYACINGGALVSPAVVSVCLLLLLLCYYGLWLGVVWYGVVWCGLAEFAFVLFTLGFFGRGLGDYVYHTSAYL